MLQLILGRSGYGKTEYVFRQIKEMVERGEEQAFLLVPEQFSFVSERRLLTDLGEDKMHCAEVSSFSHLVYDVSNRYGGDELPVLTKGARAVMMKRALETVQDGLKLYSRHVHSASFIRNALSIYDEMKSCRVFLDDIEAAAENCNSELLKNKLHDIALIIASYDALIDGVYYDSENELTRLYHKLLQHDYFTDKTVFIDGFNGFVAQEYKILEVILCQAKKVYITFCGDSGYNAGKYDLFSYVNRNIQILKDVCKKSHVPFMEPIILHENYRAQNDELKVVELNAFSNVPKQCLDAPSYLHLYAAKNITDECDRVSLYISDLLRSGYRAKDIAVICRDMAAYEKELQFSFSKFNIPYFQDERQAILSQPLMMLVNFLLRTVIYSIRSEDVFSLLKTGLTPMSSKEISALENYAFVWNINGRQWTEEFTESPKGFAESLSEHDVNRLKELNESRTRVVSVIQKFKKRVHNATCADICRAVYFALCDFKADEQLKKLAMALESGGNSALSEEQGRIWDLLMEILDKLSKTGESKPISVAEFYKLFHLMIAAEDLGTLPSGLDNVQVGAADRIRCDNPRVVFVLGANEGEFPKAFVSTGLLNEKDRWELIENNQDFKLYAYGETLAAQEKYFAYMAVCAAREQLYVSYIDPNNKEAESCIVRGLRAAFPSIKTEYPAQEITCDILASQDNAFELLASNYKENSTAVSTLKAYFETLPTYRARLDAVNRLVKNDDIRIADSRVSTALFKDNMYLSASRIEDYFNCSFRYFCKFGLGVRPLLRAQMDLMQTGTVVHYVLEHIVSECGTDGLIALNDSEIMVLVNQYLETYLSTKMGDFDKFTPRFKYQFMRLSKMLIAVVLRLRDEFSVSDFKAQGFEITIGDGSDEETVKSAVLHLPDGGSIQIKGAVDRVDIYDEDGTRYIRVVDYKTGIKKFSLSDVLYGLNLQMFIYLFTLSQSESEYNGVASGVLYMHSSRAVINAKYYGDTAKVDKEENDKFKMYGVVLNDENHEMAQHMEHDLKGRFIPASGSDGGVSGSIVSLEELGLIAGHIDALLKQMGVSLHAGNITQNPVNGGDHKNTCEHCDYISVCQNRKEVPYREINKLSEADTLSVLKGGDSDAAMDNSTEERD